MKKMIKKIFFENSNNFFLQFIRYFFVGGIAAVVNIGLLYIFSDFLNINYIISNIVSFSAGLIVNYILSKCFVFKTNSLNVIFEFIIYLIIGVLGLIIDTVILWFLTSKFKIYYMISKIISTIITFIWNFLSRKIFYLFYERRR
ncbi:MAG: GtrA family protein [Bacilli bacterium]|nr:GtrA family protein [Bacilli bacterium]